jgi:HAE1 family hydrophobic/amphiphilic exporter-1
LFALALLLSLIALQRYLLPPIFFPDSDRHQFLVEVFMPPGAPFEETDAAMHEVESALAAHPEIESWGTYIGAGAPKFFINQFTEGKGLGIGMAIVNTNRDLPVERTPTMAAELEHELKGSIAGPFVRVQKLRQGYGGVDDIEIFIEGDNLDVLRGLAVGVRDIVREVPGTRNVRESFGFDPLTFEARVNAARANLLGVTHTDIATTLRTALDGVTATTFREEDEEIDIVVRIAEWQRRNVSDLMTLPVFSQATGGTVPLAHVAEIEPGFSNRMILRWNRKREANISAEVVGRPVYEATQEIERLVHQRISLPPGYTMSFQGERKEVTESFLSLARAAVTAVFLIYIILVLRFHSLSQPGLIVLAIPMALIGGIWGLILTANPLGFMAFLGMIALTGVVVNDSIILLDYINTLRQRGVPLKEAVTTGAVTRLRAVTLTTFTTIGGLLPLSLTGGQFFGPFGFTMIFGLAASMGLTLLVQPAAYLALEKRRKRTVEVKAEELPSAAATRPQD